VEAEASRMLLVHGAHLAPHAGDIAELAQRLLSRSGRCHPASHQLIGARIEMKLQLGVDILPDVRTPESEIAAQSRACGV
jgi:hypothetical protein